jgi:hypothetical protein
VHWLLYGRTMMLAFDYITQLSMVPLHAVLKLLHALLLLLLLLLQVTS